MSNETKSDIPVQHVLSFSTDAEEEQVFIHADAAGIDFLINSLDHDHLFTNDWSGNGDLSTRVLDKQAHLVHHVKVYGWTAEWVGKHHLNDSDPHKP